MNITECLLTLRPGASFTVWNNDLEQVVDWRDERSIPTLAECEAVWPEVERKLAVPKVISRAQLKIGLIRCGIPPASVRAAIAAIPDTQAREEAQVSWEDSEEMHRDNPLVLAIGAVLGKSELEIDAVFTAGAAA